jgi:DNA-binding NarL/FixJ family response regulator
MKLSPRQEQIIRLVAQGKSSKVIAAELGIHIGTVKTHIATVLVKMNARNRTEAATLWVTGCAN